MFSTVIRKWFRIIHETVIHSPVLFWGGGLDKKMVFLQVRLLPARLEISSEFLVSDHVLDGLLGPSRQI